MHARLGLNVHRDAWPTTAALSAYEAAGFAWVQVHAPPRAMLSERRHGLRHGRAVRAALDGTGLRLLLHAPDDLSAGTIEHDRAFAGLLDHAEAAEARRCHDPLAVRDLVRRLDSPAAGMLLDLGHLHITADARHSDRVAVLAACAPDVVLFHAHDNLGCRRVIDAPGADPIRLDLHLPPGRGSLPWTRVAGTIAAHSAPVMLEVERSYRPALEVLAADAARLLSLAGAPAAAA